MVQIIVTQTSTQINDVLIKGHANFQDQNDMVCAGASSIVFGILNAIDQQSSTAAHIDVRDNEVHIKVTEHNVVIDTILKTMVIQLTTISQKFAKHVNISNIVK